MIYPGAVWGCEVRRDARDEPRCFDRRQFAIGEPRAMAIAMSPGVVRIEDAGGFVETEGNPRPGQQIA
jgi:hypothetical protein